MISFLYGIILGAATVGAHTYRTVATGEGNPAGAFVASILVSLTYWFGIVFIVNDDLPGYIGFSAGGAAVVTGLAYYYKRRDEDQASR